MLIQFYLPFERKFYAESKHDIIMTLLHTGNPLTPIPRFTEGYIKITKNVKSVKIY